MNDYLTLIICIICIIAVIVAQIFRFKGKIDGEITLIIVWIVIMAMFVSLILYKDARSEKELEAMQHETDAYWNDIDTKAETYKILLDGKEVDKDSIDIHLYSISVNDEKQTIYITN